MNARRDAEYTEYVAVHLPALRRLALLLCQDWQCADDLVQATITRALPVLAQGPRRRSH